MGIIWRGREILDFGWGEVREEETDNRFTMARTLTDPQAVGREFHLGFHGGFAIRQNCRNLNGEGARAGMMRGFGKEPRSRALWVLEIATCTANRPMLPPPSSRWRSNARQTTGKRLPRVLDPVKCYFARTDPSDETPVMTCED